MNSTVKVVAASLLVFASISLWPLGWAAAPSPKSETGKLGAYAYGQPPPDGWRTSPPEQQGIDSAVLAAAFDHIQENELPIHSLLIIRHGYLVLEAYFYPYSGQTLHNWASVTKSITSTLVGRALEEGHIKSIRQPIVDFFPNYRDALSGAKRSITVEHLLMMATGLDCGYQRGELELLAMERSQDYVASVLALPMVTKPGSEFSYCSGGMHLLSAIVTRSTKMSALDFARQQLFSPLGIEAVIWPADPQGITHGWADLRLHPRDMAKIGYLYLRGGQWDGKPILSSTWIHRSTERHMDVPRDEADYGYGWWIMSGEFSGVYEARGRGDQSVSVWPEKDLVVVMNGAGRYRSQLVPFLRAALKSDQPLPENSPAYQRLQTVIAAVAKPPLPKPVPPLPDMARTISGRTYLLEPNLFEVKTISLQFTQRDEARFNFILGDRAFTVSVGLDGVYRFCVPNPSEPSLAARGFWNTNQEFVIDYTEADGPNHYRIDLRFEDGKVAVKLDDLTGHFPIQLLTGRAQK